MSADDVAVRGAVPGDDQPQPWERQPGETPRAFHAFTHYRDLGPGRSVDRAWRAHRTACEGQITDRIPAARARNWARLAARWGWGDRAADWDSEVDRQTRQRTAAEHADIRLRHARLAQAAATALTVPVRATIDALQQDPQLIAKLVARTTTDPMALLAVVAVVARVAGLLPGLATMERIALGMPLTPPSDERPGGTFADRFSQRITSDEVATDLAIALLDRLAHDDTPRPH